VLTSIVAGLAPPMTVMVKALFAKPVATDPSGSSEGVNMLAEADQPLGLAGSFHVPKLMPREGTAPTEPPKVTLPLVAEMKSAMAFAPLVNSVG
jgi:hypothetical protein